MAISTGFSTGKQSYGKQPQDLFSTSNKLKFIANKVAQIQTINHLLDNYLDNTLRQHCHVCAVQNGHLVIYVDNPSWSLQLRSNIPHLLSRLRSEGKQHGLVSIKCKTSPNTIIPKPLERPKNPIEKLSRQSANCLKDTAKHIKHDGLRDSLERLAKHVK